MSESTRDMKVGHTMPQCPHIVTVSSGHCPRTIKNMNMHIAQAPPSGQCLIKDYTSADKQHTWSARGRASRRFVGTSGGGNYYYNTRGPLGCSVKARGGIDASRGEI